MMVKAVCFTAGSFFTARVSKMFLKLLKIFLIYDIIVSNNTVFKIV